MSLPDAEARPLLTVDEARHAVGDVLGRSAFYVGLSSGAIPGLRRVGRRSFVCTAELRAWVGVDMPVTNGTAANGTLRQDE